MPIRFPAFEGCIYERLILSRGLNMYEEDFINHVQATGTNEWSIEISSERVDWVHYDVEIGINNGRVTFSDCNCPYNQGPVCKHIVAALYYIRDNNLYVEGGMEEEDSDDEDDGEEGEEEEEEDSRVPRRSQRSSNNSSKSKSKRNSTSNNTSSLDLLDLGNEALNEADDVEKEFYCQVCLGIMSQPVSMPCHAHSVCYDCTMLLYKHQRKENNGYKLISCPTCREGSGALKIKKSADIKVNLELKRIKEAYLKKKRGWMKEKQALEEMLGLNNKEEGNKKALEDGKDGKKNDNNVLNNDMMVEEEIETMDLGRLGEIAVKVLERLHANGLTGGPVLEKYKEYFEQNEIKEDLLREKVPGKIVKKPKEDVKVKEKSGFKREREVKSDEEATIGRRYSLRNLKKVKKI